MENQCFNSPEEVSKDIEVTLSLITHPNSNISLSTNKIKCTARVEQITEKRIEVPIEVLNAPDSLLLVILPKSIEVTCQVGLSDYDRVETTDFRAIVDFASIDLFKERSIRILLREQPQFVKQVHYAPKT